jgi:hypothetical protein
MGTVYSKFTSNSMSSVHKGAPSSVAPNEYYNYFDDMHEGED